jgi:hypothetical protein
VKTFTITAKVQTPNRVSVRKLTEHVQAHIAAALPGGGLIKAVPTATDVVEGDLVVVDDVDLAEILCALDVTSKVHATLGDQVMADHYAGIAAKYREAR